jgi:uncharacterized protein (DUF433 family)
MGGEDSYLIGTGIYGVPEAARLTGVSAARIRRWLRGYHFTSSGSPRTQLPVWSPMLPEIDGKLALAFLDLVEIRFVDAFLNEGVTWQVLRKAAAKAKDLVGSSHPFSTRKFKTDGRRIFAEMEDAEGETSLLELLKSQHYFERVVSPYLRDLEFEGDEPSRWWPMGLARRQIVIDPTRSFGQPIVAARGIPTAILAQAVKAHGSVAEIARWYETDVASVRAAVKFEQRLSQNRIAA